MRKRMQAPSKRDSKTLASALDRAGFSPVMAGLVPAILLLKQKGCRGCPGQGPRLPAGYLEFPAEHDVEDNHAPPETEPRDHPRPACRL